MYFRTGEIVEVLGPEEILKTLDADGTIDNMPFMPEMAKYCGSRLRVARRAEKACVEYPGGGYQLRAFRNDDVLVLETLRCDGCDHGGCGRGCLFFWKEAWVRKVQSGEPGKAQGSLVKIQQQGMDKLLAHLKTMSAPDRYFCQSTELAKTTEPLTKVRILAKCVNEVRSGSRTVTEMVRMIVKPSWRKATGRFPRPKLKGSLKRTPVGELQLQPGEWVQVKSVEDIAKTLDTNGRNRGLLCNFEMCRNSGETHQVRNRLDRMILESSGEMKKVEGTVILDGVECICPNVLGGCPRQDLIYWREVWLNRANQPAGSGAHAPEGTAPKEKSSQPVA